MSLQNFPMSSTTGCTQQQTGREKTEDVKKKEKNIYGGSNTGISDKIYSSSHFHNDKTKGGGIYTSKIMLWLQHAKAEQIQDLTTNPRKTNLHRLIIVSIRTTAPPNNETNPRCPKASYPTVGRPTNEPTLFRQQRRDDLPMDREKLPINPTPIMRMFSWFDLNRFYLHHHNRKF